ncbi:MAG: large subunit ribosomal protein L4 [Microgenomates group bacterium LiPW_31]|nr:MAG: large subunit ribosomal protein L4 [Microgenomates group bacterium LiPW_31]
MPKISVFTIAGKKSDQITLPSKIFAAKVNNQLMAQAVRVYLSNQRKAGAKAKTRAEVSGSGRKIWRQKGTGRARHGDQYAPIFVGGGVAHGPTGSENYQLKMSKRMRQQALFSALTSKFKDGEIIAVKGLAKIEPKTKEMMMVLEKLTRNWKLETRNWKLTLVLPELIENVIRAARNIEGVKLTQVNMLNTYDVLNGGKLIFMKESIDKLKEIWI